MSGRKLTCPVFEFRAAAPRCLAALLLVVALAAALPALAHQRPLRPEVESFVQEMEERHGYRAETLRRWLGQVKPRGSILRAISAPSTALPWHEFRDRFLTESRISSGVRFWLAHAETLARAAKEYRVPEEIIVATIGVETFYGRQTGSFGVLEALATLAFDYPPRAPFFRSELEEFLLLVREEEMDPLRLKGSYAGAMGIAQFMPSSFRRYAVDFDGDGKIDIWRSAADAIGSVANYYRAFDWRPESGIVVPARAEGPEIEALLRAGIKPVTTVEALRARGVEPLEPVDGAAQAALFVVDTGAGKQAYLGLHNFYVITRYNRSVNYAMVVLKLARELRELAAGASTALSD